ncbi:hypothetical protein [Pseudoclavibacter helvolus]|uniref:hypothetical protein n=1 Tax=Pseudoclavibacter helvolus TaxID=255205 RepID=UPI003C727D69
MNARQNAAGIDREAKELGYLWPLGIAAAGLVVLKPLENLVGYFVDGSVRVNASFEGAAVSLPAPVGADIPLQGASTMLVAGDLLPTGALVLLLIGQAIGALLSVAAVCVLFFFVRNLAKGDFFGRKSIRLLDWSSGLVVMALAAPGFFELLGTNWTIAKLGWDGADAPEPTILDQTWTFLLILVILLVVNLIMRRGARLQLDQEGLV